MRSSLKIWASIGMAVLLLVSFSACLGDGGDDGANGDGDGYGITLPVSDLILSDEDLSGWYSWSGSSVDYPVEDYNDHAVAFFIDSVDSSQANHSMVLLIMEFDGYDDANDSYDLIVSNMDQQYELHPVDVGTEGFYITEGNHTSAFFKKYRYVTVLHYTPLTGDALSLSEILSMAQTQSDNIVYDTENDGY